MTIPAESDRVSILLVDDQPANLVSLRAILERPDYDLVLAQGGQEALALVLRREFAVILLDVAMPDIDGFEVAATIKQRESFRTIPIIFVTATSGRLDWIYRAYDAGAVDFLIKPLDPHAVRSKVGVFVELHRQRQHIQRQTELLREQERRLHEQRFRDLADCIPHVVWVATPDGRIEYVSRRWASWTGRADASALDGGWLDAVDPEDARGLRATWEASIQAGAAFEFSIRLRRADGALRWQHGRAVPERDETGAVVRWLGTLTDIDDERRAREELVAALQLRDEFVQVASHELRTPLAALQLRLQALKRRARDELVPEAFEQGLSQAVRQGERMGELVSRLLDVSQLTDGGMRLELGDVDLVEVAHEVVGRLATESERVRTPITVDSPGSLRGTWDRTRVEQMLTNLLANAVKYGDRKPIELSLEETEGGTARVVVRDHGIGIAPEARERIFRRFERAASSRNYGGLGLGLYVVAQVVAAHGGRVDVASSPGEGCTFTVELPRQPMTTRSPPRPAAELSR
jgi:PAS domain S-box-containing protein